MVARPRCRGISRASVSSYGVPLIIGVLAVALLVLLFIKYGRRSVKAAG